MKTQNAHETLGYEQQNPFDVNRAINLSYAYTDKTLNSASRYPILQHEDAVFLINELDVIIRSCILFCDQFTPWFRNEFADVVSRYMFNPSNRNVFCGKHDDSVLVSAAHWLADPKGMHHILSEEVGLFRLFWLQGINRLSRCLEQCSAWVNVDPDAENYLGARTKLQEMSDVTKIPVDVLYGVFNELRYYVKRISRVQDKLTMPYLRRVAALAKSRARGGKYEACLDNYQSGVTGVTQAIGRYDTTLGSYASLVDLWVNNRMLTWIRKSANPIRIPDRAHKHKRDYDRLYRTNPQLSLEDAADRMGLHPKVLAESLAWVDMQGSSQLIDESSTDDFGAGAEDYISPESIENDSVNSFLREYGNVLSERDKATLFLLYDCPVDFKPLETVEARRESLTNLVLSHYLRISR